MLDRRPARLQTLDDRRERAIVEEDAVLGMVDDIFELVVEQPWIEGVKNPAHADDPKPCDEVAIMVHGHRRDSVARLYAEPFKSLRQTSRVMRHPLPICPVGRSVRPTANDLARSMLALGMVHQAHDTERKILHRAER